VKRDLGDGFELDDDKARTDRADVHRFLSEECYWAQGRPRETQEALIDGAARVVGLFKDGAQIGFCRAATDYNSFVYLADVYVVPEFRGRGLGEELVREMVERGPLADRKWLLHTSDAHELYRKLGFDTPSYKVMERDPTRNSSDSG
jgi:ribosomal protein S18 acetylase RimI-like enzyme